MMIQKAFSLKTCLLLILALMSFDAVKAQNKKIKKTKPLFQSEVLLNIRLEADFKSIFSNTDDSTYFPATVTIPGDSGQSETIAIQVRSRGNTRREKDVCLFAPLRLKFPKKESKNTVFEGQKNLKLVTHCNKSDLAEQNTITEYLIYKAFNVLTDSSFKVRPVIINYVYAGNKKDSVQKFAFFIEPDRDLAERLQCIEIESEKIHPNRLHSFHTCLMDMFQYMIGNTDYSAYELHNIVLVVDSLRRAPPLAIPYDFDWSGLVSANYAVPNPRLHTKSVRERVYRGFIKQPEIVYHTIQIFLNKKEEIYQLFQNCELLKKSKRKQVLQYLDKFYEIINNDQMIKTEFIDNARVVHD